jgi:hypothetical protein
VSDATNDQPLGFIDAEPARPVGQEDPVARPEDARALRTDEARRSGYHSRFVAVYLGLAVAAGIGVGALVASMLRDDPPPAKTTAAQFSPSRTGELGAAELAENIERKYRLQNGDELTGVIATRNTLQDGGGGFLRVGYQLVQPFDAAGDADTRVVHAENAIQYSLCGYGPKCALPGTASLARYILLKRQGLELAVRTFQNDSSVDNVAVFLAPVTSDDPNWEGYAMVFDRSTLQRNEPTLLSRPLGQSLPGSGKTVTPGDIGAAQIKAIDKLTRAYTYQYRYKVLGGRDAVMQLQPTKR